MNAPLRPVTKISRRFFASTSTALFAAGFLAACATGPDGKTTVNIPQVANDASLIATAFDGMVVALSGIQGFPPDTLATVKVYLAQIRQNADAIAAATVNDALTHVDDIAKLVGDIAGAVLQFVPGGSQIDLVVKAAQALIPVMEAALGSLKFAGAPPLMSAPRARSVLAEGVHP